MKSRLNKAWCGLFSGVAAGAGALTYLACTVPPTVKSDISSLVDEVINSVFSLQNQTLVATSKLLPDLPIEVTIQEFAFPLRNALSKNVIDLLNKAQDFSSETTQKAILIGGAACLLLIAHAGTSLYQNHQLRTQFKVLQARMDRELPPLVDESAPTYSALSGKP